MTTQFEIPYTQYLDEQGQPLGELPSVGKDSEKLLALYRVMVQTRLFDNKAIALQRTGKLGTFPATTGQEAIPTAIGATMEPTDVFCPYYREHATQFQRGVTMAEILAYWGGDERGSDYKNCREDMPTCVPIASQNLHAVGVATAFKLRKQPRVAVTTIGDGGTSKGDFYEAMNVAGEWNLPVVFVVNNNQWAISVPRAAQTHCETFAQKAYAAGIPGEQVDGNDIIAMVDVMGKALSRAREGQGPSVIEAITYRLCDHTTADDATRYHDQKAYDEAWNREPIKRFRRYLEANHLWDDHKEADLQHQLKQDLKAAVETYLAMAPPNPEDMFDSLYETLPEAYQEQRDMVCAFEEDHNG